jgi:hypothetical protein
MLHFADGRVIVRLQVLLAQGLQLVITGALTAQRQQQGY